MSLSVGSISGAIVFDDQFSKPLKQAEKSADKFADKTSKDFDKVSDHAAQTQDGITALVGAFAAFEGVKAIASAAASFANMGAELEQTRVSMEVFLGSAEKANQVIADLNKFSAVTPFTSDQVLQAGKSLLAFGLEAEKLQDTLRAVGDVSAGTGKDFNELALIYGKAMTSGVVQAEELNQLTEAGVPIIKELAKNMGVAENQVKKLGSEGKISFADLEKAFESMTAEGGQFFDLMAKQSQTTAGLMSTLKGVVQQLGAEISEQMLEGAKPALEAVTNASMALLDTWNSLDDDTKELIGTLVLVNGTIALVGAGVIAAKVAYTAAMAAMAASNTAFMATLGPIGIAMGVLTAGIIAYNVHARATTLETVKNADAMLDASKNINRLEEKFRSLAKSSANTAEAQKEMQISMSELAAAAANYGINVDKTNTSLEYQIKMLNKTREAQKEDLKMQMEIMKIQVFNRLQEMKNAYITYSPAVRQAADDTLTFMLATDDVGRSMRYAEQRFADAGRSLSTFNNVTTPLGVEINDLSRGIQGLDAALQRLPGAVEPPTRSIVELGNAAEESTSLIREMGQSAQNMQEQVGKIDPDMTAWYDRLAKRIADVGPIEAGIKELGDAIGDELGEAISDNSDKIAKSLEQIFDAAIQNMEAGFELAKANLQATIDIVDFFGEVQQREMQKRHDEETESFESMWGDKLNVARSYIAELELLKDEEWQKEKARMQEAYELRREQARLEYEAELEKVRQQSANKEQARVNEEIMQEGWKRRQKEMEDAHLEEIDAARDKHMKGYEVKVAEQQNKIEAMEQEKAAASQALQERQAEEEKKRSKEVAIVKTMLEYQVFQAEKQAQMAQATISFAQAMMSAVQAAASIATIPLIGWAMAPVVLATLTGLAASTYNMTRGAIQAQRFIPPAELFAERGGMLQGPSHAAGGIAVRAEGGERIIDQERTGRLNKWIDTVSENPEQAMGGDRIVVNLSMAGANIFGTIDTKTAQFIAEKTAVYVGQYTERRRIR